MPLGAKMTQTDSDADTNGFVQNLTNKLHRQVEKDSKTDEGLKMGSIAGNDQNTLLYDFMQKIEIKCRKNCKVNLKTELVTYIAEAQ